MKPDWAAWAPEPWAQQEIATRPPTSPYATYAGGEPPVDAVKDPPPPILRAAHPSPPPDTPRLAAPPGLPAPPPNRKARRAQAREARRATPRVRAHAAA